ncbi:hypothetical protein [Treponema endosymbiont of Eucomonympha sp.]|uniref:hypothetical protein n=1 Tax=Treponema endosymbiont of Eucomonympha sp. TaxID=1580831 RepID=UPI001EE6E751|nr:hypothetical protein [Treponema endosymbiont of Eucomonympha sp.]
MKENDGIRRHDISGEARERIKELLPGQAGKHGERRKTADCSLTRQRGRCARAFRGETCRQNSGTGTACTSGFAAGGTREYRKRRRTPQ